MINVLVLEFSWLNRKSNKDLILIIKSSIVLSKIFKSSSVS